MTDTMRPLEKWPLQSRRRITGVFTDIDDTLTTDGTVTPDAWQALVDLKAAGLHVIPITGRPAGWSEPFAATWPVDAIVAENGAVALRCDGKDLKKLYQQSATLRAANFLRMQQVAERVLREVPGAMLSRDSPGRECDVAIDHSEFTHLAPDAIARIVAIMQAEGMHATVSSIHINGWFGTHSKLEGARWILRELFGRSLDAELAQWTYVGDSTNDQVMFGHFPHSIGVANIARFLPCLKYKPRYVTMGARGAGFAEVAAAILAAR